VRKEEEKKRKEEGVGKGTLMLFKSEKSKAE
jgi:hypothetical protein